VLRPGGRYISVCVHPCLNGGYSDLQPDGSVVVRAGYEATGYQPQSDFRTTIRSHVGAWQEGAMLAARRAINMLDKHRRAQHA